MSFRRYARSLAAWLLVLAVIFQTGLTGALGEGAQEWTEATSGTYEEHYYSVRFEADGNTVETLFVQEGAPIGKLPEAPRKDKYTFICWTSRDAAELNEQTIVTGDMVCVASYEAEWPAATMDAGTDTVSVHAEIPEGALPKDTQLLVTPVDGESCRKAIEGAIGGEVGGIQAVDISFVSPDGKECKPELPVRINLTLNGMKEAESLAVLHIGEDGQTELVAEGLKGTELSFETESLQVYAIVEACLSKTITATDGKTYDIRVTYRSTSEIPTEGTALAVTEILPDDARYGGYLSATAEKLGTKKENVELSRMFDIRIVDAKDQTIVYEPTGDVDVTITLTGTSLDRYEHVGVLHFVQAATLRKTAAAPTFTVQEMKSAVDGETVSFSTDSFSVYVIAGYKLEKIIRTGDGKTYRITVEYDEKAGIPGDAELNVEEVEGDQYLSQAADALGWKAGDEAYYTKFLDISIEKDGREIEPQSQVLVTVELLDVTDGAEALEVVHFTENGAEKVESEASAEGIITFTTDSFSTYGFGSVLHTLLSWTNNAVNYTLQGFSTLLKPTYQAIELKMEEGLEVLNAYHVESLLGNLLNALYVKVTTGLQMTERESIVVYGVNDGHISGILEESKENLNQSVALGNADGFAVVLDSGYRRKDFQLGDVELSGMMPKASEAEAEKAEENNIHVGGTLLTAYDIRILDNGSEYQPDEDHPVDVSILVGEKEDAILHVWHILDDGTSEEIMEYAVRDGKVIFTAPGFSIYAITEGETGDNARIGYRFWYNDGSQNVLLTTQYFRYKDLHPEATLTLREPSIPGMENTWTRIFKGWSKTSSNDADENLLTIVALNAELAARPESSFEEGTIIDVFANLNNVYYVTYVDVNPNNILATEIVPVAETGNTTFSIKGEQELRPTIMSGDELIGWYDISNPDDVYEPGQENVLISSSITLYPKVTGGNWLIFDDNDPVWSVEKQAYVSGGASYTPPTFYLNEVTVEPPAPTWTGYTFDGWYLDQAGTIPFEFGGELEHDTTVYAKWTPAQTVYRVVYWKQRPTDDVDATEEEKTYEYAGSRLVEHVPTGQIAALEERDKRFYGANGTSGESDQGYFVYNNGKTDQQIVVKADGSSVLNVYYDRQVITINFDAGDGYLYRDADQYSSQCYGYVNGNYVSITPDDNGGWTYNSTRVVTYTGTRYIVHSNNFSNNTMYYYVSNGRMKPVYYYERRWYETKLNDWTYADLIAAPGTVYDQTTNNNGTQYTETGIQLTRSGNRPYTWSYSETITGTYTGRIYEKTAQLKGLYGRSMAPGEWPTLANGNWWQFEGQDSVLMLNAPWNSYIISANASLAQIQSRTWNLVDANTSTTSGQRIVYHGENINGEYSIVLADTYRGLQNLMLNNNKFYGYKMYGWRHGSGIGGGDWHDLSNLSTSMIEADGGYNWWGGAVYYDQYYQEIHIYYSRDKFSLTFYPNNGYNPDIFENIPYEKPLGEYANHGVNPKRGYFFQGWYADPSCSEPFDFDQTMPHSNVAVYGKWSLRRVRVVVEPGASNVYMGSQATSFRVDFDEKIDGGLMENAQRAGYILDGWYTDPEFTHPFLFEDPINDDIDDIEWDYQEDRWRATRIAYGDDSPNYNNVRGIMHLYAKWIPDLDSRGINIVYEPGDAAIYDSIGNLQTNVPVDPHMYDFNATATAREAPSNYSDMYAFMYWEATLQDGTTREIIYASNPINLSELMPVDPIYDEADELQRYTVVLRAVYDMVGDPERQTTITYDGNTFTETMYNGSDRVMKGKTADGTNRQTITLDKEVNQTIELPTADDFYMDGWELVGWSFTEGTYAEQTAGAEGDPLAPNYTPGQQVAADNLIISDLNDEENTLYAMWQPKKYTVTVRQVVENGVPVNNFIYPHKEGVENALGSVTETATTLTGNNSFTVENLEYYDRVGHVMRITTPEIPEDASYEVRVNATVQRDDGTVETLNPTALGNYPVLGNVTITYTYSPKVLVKLRKRDATNHNTVLTGAVFTVIPVEFNSSTNRWENAGTGKTLTINQATLEQHLQEGTYRLTETSAPTDYARISTELYLTIRKDAAFTLFTATGTDVSESIAELDSTGKILTVYDNPIRKITLKKKLQDTVAPGNSFSFTVTVHDEQDNRVRTYDIGCGTTNTLGQVSVELGDEETAEIRIPHGYKLAVTETSVNGFVTTYRWNNGSAVESNAFPERTITANGTLEYTNVRKYTLTYRNLPDSASGFTGSEAHDFDGENYTTDPEYTITMPEESSTRYHFVGWATEENGPVVYQPDDTEEIQNLEPDHTGDKVLYAVWDVALTVEKQVTGGWGEPNRDFEFTMTIAGSESGTTYTTVKDSVTTELSVNDQSRLTFTLRDDQTFLIYLPVGQSVTVRETSDTETSRYKTTWDTETENTKVKTLTADENKTVVVTNRLDPVAPTGYHVTVFPYILLLAAGSVLLALCLGNKRKAAGRKGGGGADA